MTKNIPKLNNENAFNYLNQIIETQARLAKASFDLNAFMDLVVNQVKKITGATGVVVELVDGDDMVYQAANGTVKKYIGLRLPRSNSISGLCVKQKKILRSDDTYKDPRVNLEACKRVHARSMVVAPLFNDGDAVGVIKILSRKPDAFSVDDVKILTLMSELIGSALGHQLQHKSIQQLLDERTKALEQLKETEEKLKYDANHDFLTGLPNRGFFLDILDATLLRAKRSGNLIAVFFLDIDHFKKINDTYGHDIGDELLKAFSSRIKKKIRETDSAARMGGDEFVILLDNIASQKNAINIAKKIIGSMKNKFKLKNEILHISTSIGIAFCKDPDIGADELIKHADEALYKAKKAGRNNYKIY